MQSSSPCPKHLATALSASQQLRFSPQVHELDRLLYPFSQKPLRSTQDIWESLTRDLRGRNQLRQALKAQNEQEQLRQCSFGEDKLKQDSRRAGSAFSRLYQQAEERRMQQITRQQLKQEQQAQQLCQQQSKSRTLQEKKLNSQKLDLSPLYLRLEEVIKNQAQQRRRAELNQLQPTFKPTIDPHSLLLSSKQNRISCIVDRLLEDHKQREVRKQEFSLRLRSEMEKELTFKPKVNPQLPPHLLQNSKRQQCQDGTLEPFTFSPEIDPLSRLLTRERNLQTSEQQLFRLSQAPLIQKQRNMEVLASEQHRLCPFNPQINDLSKELCNGTPPKHCCPLPQQQTPSHRPKINPASASLSHTQRARTCQYSKRRQQRKAHKYLQESEYLAMKECTFRPSTGDPEKGRALRKAGSLALVPGYQQFRVQRDRVRELQRDLRERQERVFNLEKSYDARKKRETSKRR